MRVNGRFLKAWQRSRQALQRYGLGLVLCVTQTQAVAHAEDSGVPLDAGVVTVLDAGDSSDNLDGGGADAGIKDAGETRPVTAACSCETNTGQGEREIHLCTGSFERDVCKRFSCDRGTLRSARCREESPVRLCCDMKARGLYTSLYEDCRHPNCETGFRAQCADFGGEVQAGPCQSNDGVDDPDTELGDDGGCSVRADADARSAFVPVSVMLLWLAIRGRQRRHQPRA